MEERLGFEFTLSYRPFKAWSINSDFNLFNVTSEGDYTSTTTNNTQNFDFENTAFFLRLNQKITLPGKTDLQINSNYRGASQNAQSNNNGIFTMDIAASKDLFQEKMSISLNVSDVFNGRRRQTTTIIEGFSEQYSEFQWRERQIRVSLIYRFNQDKDKFRPENENQENDGDFEG